MSSIPVIDNIADQALNVPGHKTLGEFAAEDMQNALVLKKFGLDFCCGGKQTLEEACARKQLNPGVVYRAMEAAKPEVPGPNLRYREWPAGFLADFIVQTHHVFVRKTLPDLVAFATKVARVHGDRHPELHELLDIVHALNEEMMSHMHKEEHILFPYIKALDGDSGKPGHCFPSVQSPIRVMEMEHEHAGGLVARAREITNQFTPPEGACGSYRLLFQLLEEFESDLHIHVHLENNILFPAAIQLEKQNAVSPD